MLKREQQQVWFNYLAIIVYVRSVDNTLFLASDFFPFFETLIFEPFQVNKTATFIIHSDNILELNEQFSLVLVSNDDDVLIQDGRNTLQVTIIDQTGKFCPSMLIYCVHFLFNMYDILHRSCYWI